MDREGSIPHLDPNPIACCSPHSACDKERKNQDKMKRTFSKCHGDKFISPGSRFRMFPEQWNNQHSHNHCLALQFQAHTTTAGAGNSNLDKSAAALPCFPAPSLLPLSSSEKSICAVTNRTCCKQIHQNRIKPGKFSTAAQHVPTQGPDWRMGCCTSGENSWVKKMGFMNLNYKINEG